MTQKEEVSIAKKGIEGFDKNSSYKMLNVNDIKENTNNDYEMTDIESLKEDIARNGLLHNLVVSRRANEEMILISGNRRLAAIKQLKEETKDKKWNKVHVKVYENLTPRQEMLILDAANLQARGSSTDGVQRRKVTERYKNNIKEEFEISEKAALQTVISQSGASVPTIRSDIAIQEKLIEDIIDLLDDRQINNGDAKELTYLSPEQQEEFYANFTDAEDDDEQEQVMEDWLERIKQIKEEKKEGKKPSSSGYVPDELDLSREETNVKSSGSSKKSPAEMAGEVTTTIRPVGTNDYSEKIENMISQIKALNTKDIVAQIYRIDERAREAGQNTILGTIDRLNAEVVGLKTAIKEANGDIELNIDPVTGHRMGNSGEEGYVAD